MNHQVAGGVLVLLISAVCGLAWDKLDESSFQKVKLISTDFLTTKITLPVWVVILAVVILALIIRTHRYILARQSIIFGSPILNEKIGSL